MKFEHKPRKNPNDLDLLVKDDVGIFTGYGNKEEADTTSDDQEREPLSPKERAKRKNQKKTAKKARRRNRK